MELVLGWLLVGLGLVSRGLASIDSMTEIARASVFLGVGLGGVTASPEDEVSKRHVRRASLQNTADRSAGAVPLPASGCLVEMHPP